MRNFKKILSLVLAMAMALSLAVTAGAAFADQDDITPAYEEAVAVLSGTGVFEGYTDGSFGPQNTITRAETAAIIYRVVTGDVDDEQVDVFADYNVFTDVPSTAWYAGYVNFCANAQFILGYGDGTFGPQDKVTGYQALAMILRAVGYDQENEFAGPNWLVNTASVAKELGILENVAAGDSLGVAAPRELVAELLFQAINVPTVTHTPALGYKDWTGFPTRKNDTLGEKAFGLTETSDFDNWGRPATEWYDSADTDTVYATIPETPVAVYTEAVTECAMAKDLGLKENASYDAVLNAKAEANGTINLTDTTTKIGAQGRLTEVYENENDTYRIVMVDQFLAEVGKVTEVKYDTNGHITKQATMALTIYDETATGTPVTLKADENFAYAEDDMVLVYAKAYTNNTTTDIKDGAYEVGTEVEVATMTAMAEVIDLADSIDGKQTKITTKASHIVNGTEYMDAVQFNLDQAVNNTGDYTWYFDTYGNLIGDVVIDTAYNYGTISDIYWVDSHDGEDGYAKAEITYMDGSSAYATIATLQGLSIDSAEGKNNVDSKGNDGELNVSSSREQNAAFLNYALYKISENDDGELVLVKTTKTTATIKAGVTNIGNGYYVDKNTMFLVWDAEDEVYETYTGVRNVPNYGACSAWVAETDEDNGLEYVFIIDPTAEADDATVLYFSEDLTDFDWTLKDNQPDVYTLKGGYVNGAGDDAGTIKVKAANWNAVYNALAEDTLYLLNVEDGYVVSVEKAISSTEEVLTDANDDLFAIYEGVLTDTDTSGDLLVAADGCSYDVGGVTVIGITDWDDVEGKEIWVVYDKNGAEKIATYIYVGEAPAAE